jgi:serine/threonine-protein kinase
MAAQTPTKIGKYDVVDVIGRGGMGIVYKARDPILDRLVAIKMMTGGSDDSPELLKRFFREAQSTAMLQHQNIVTVYELGDYSGNPYLVMEYLEGESLDTLIASRKPLSLIEKVDIIINVCHGLSYAHQRNIVHRDIKPGNIMTLKQGGVKIVDFGIAHLGDKKVTRPGQVMGSFSYMSPEQISSKPIDGRTDLFSTGVVLYQLLTYVLPFEGESTAATLLKIVHEPPPSLGKFLKVYPPELENILLRCLAKDPQDRQTSAEELAIELTQLQSELRQGLVNHHFREAAVLLEKNELYKAKEQVLEILKIDRHHTKASLLLREIQNRIQQEEVAQQVRQLRRQAKDAYQQGQLQAALELVDAAFRLNSSDHELERLRDDIELALGRSRRLSDALASAESAYRRGELESAKEAIDAALEIAPEDTKANELSQAIEKDWAERSRRQQVEAYLSDARREISARRFTSALEMLRNAEALAPDAPHIKLLVESAAAGQERERKRRELEDWNRETEDALSRDDFETALSKLDSALARFPQESALLKLRELVEKRRLAAARKQFIDQQLLSARKLLENGHSEPLLPLLEGALEKVGPDPRLESLLAVVRANVEREKFEQRKTELLQRTKDLLRDQAFKEAISVLEQADSEFTGDIEVDGLLEFARDELAARQRQEKVDCAQAQAQSFLSQCDYEAAIKALESALSETSDEDLQLMLVESRKAASLYQSKLRLTLESAEKLLRNRPEEALKLLQAESASYASEPAWQKLVGESQRQLERLRSIEQAMVQASEFLAKDQFEEARNCLEESRKLHGSTPELEHRLAEVDQQRSTRSRQGVENALKDARTLTMGSDYRGALDRLGEVVDLLPYVETSVQALYESAQKEASAAAARQVRTEVEQHIAAGELTRAQDVLQRTRTSLPSLGSLSSLELIVEEEVKRKMEAARTLDEARLAGRKGDWKLAVEQLEGAFANARHAPRLREDVIGEFFKLAEAALLADWRSSENIIRSFAQLEPNYAIPDHLLNSLAERQREETIAQLVETARRLKSDHDFEGALRELSRGSAAYPDDSRLRDLAAEIQQETRQEEERLRGERERQLREDFILRTIRGSEHEAQLGKRIEVLEEALSQYPDEPRLRQALDSTRTLQSRVEQYVEAAQAEETKKHYDACLEQWQALRIVYPLYPDLEANLERVRRLQEQARAADRQERVALVGSLLATADYEGASSILDAARRAFPEDRDLSRLEKKLEEGLKNRDKAQKLLADARHHFLKQRWEKGSAELRRACAAATDDPVVRDQAVEELVGFVDEIDGQDWKSAEKLAALAGEIHPSSPLVTGLRARIDSAKREQSVSQHLSVARRMQQAHDLQGALHEVESALVLFPGDHRLSQFISEIQAQVRQQAEPLPPRQEEEQKRSQPSAVEHQGKPSSAEKPEASALTEFTSFANVEGWDESTLRAIEKQFAVFIGPVARVLVRRTATKTRDPEELYSALANSISRASDREAFLASRTRLIAPQTPSPTHLPTHQPITSNVSAPDGARPETVAGNLSPETVARASRALAPYVGPISFVLAKKAAAHADSVKGLYLLLADHITNPADRARFLKESERLHG